MRFICHFTSICNSFHLSSHSSRWREKFVEYSPSEFFQNGFIYGKLAIGYRAILRKMSARDLRNEFDRNGSSISFPLFLSFLLAISLELLRKNFPPPEENYGPNEIPSRRSEFYFTRYRDFFIAAPQPPFGSDGYFATRCWDISRGKGLLPAGETTLPSRAFVLHETPRKYIALKGARIQFL